MREKLDSLKVSLPSLAGAAAALAICVWMAHAWLSLTSGYDVNLVSGVWLALARDLRDGIFYRDLIGPAGYGGTRYFPLFFALIAAFMSSGFEAVTAGLAASVTGGLVLVSAAYAFLRQLGLPRSAAIPVTVLATAAPYFIQQTVHSIRVEPLAAGLALWGLAAVAAAERQPTSSWRTMGIAALCFTLAVAAKPTSVYAPAGAILALAFAKRWTDAWRLVLLTGIGLVALLAGVERLSEGRFLAAVRATALAGETPGRMLSSGFMSRPVALIASSRILSAIFLLTAGALMASPSQWPRLPVVVLVLAAAATAAALASPGTILTNHIVDLYVVAVLFLGWSAYTRKRAGRLGAAALAVLLLWAAGQSAARAASIRRQAPVENLRNQQAALATAVERHCAGPILAESPLVPILIGQTPTLLDPFAFRVIALRFPVADDLTARVSQREFGCVVLEQDPNDPRGSGWYRNVHLGAAVIEAVLGHYEYRESVAGHRFYTPVR